METIINAIEAPTKWTLYALQPPLKTYAKYNIALVGDAAHAMLPHLGAGAGQGLEDAYLMARLLSHPLTNSSNISGVLQAYSNARQPHANKVLEGSTRAGEVWEGRGPHGRDIEGRRKDTEGIWDWVWFGQDLDQEFADAEAWLKLNGYTGADLR